MIETGRPLPSPPSSELLQLAEKAAKAFGRYLAQTAVDALENGASTIWKISDKGNLHRKQGGHCMTVWQNGDGLWSWVHNDTFANQLFPDVSFPTVTAAVENLGLKYFLEAFPI